MIQPKNIGCRWYSSVFFLQQPTDHWFSCQMGVSHWSPSNAKTDEDQRQPMFFGCIIWAIETKILIGDLAFDTPLSNGGRGACAATQVTERAFR